MSKREPRGFAFGGLRPAATMVVVALAASGLSCGGPTSQPKPASAAESAETGTTKQAPPSQLENSADLQEAAHGQALAARWCGNCHVTPEPSDLPRDRWPFVLNWMGNYLGHRESNDEIQKLLFPSLVLTSPAITRDEFDAIIAYYEGQAPAEIAPSFPRDQPLPKTSLFKPQRWPGYEQSETASLVKIDAERRQLYVGTVSDSFLRLFSDDGSLLNRINCNQNQAVEVRPTAEGFDVALMGSIGKDDRQGTVHRIAGSGTTPGPLRFARVVTGFHRTSGATWGDLNGDGREEVVLAGYGDYEHGALSWFEVTLGQEAVRHDLRPGSGALDVVLDDVDRDGDLDILAMIAQGHQEMWWFENDGKAVFQAHLLWKERSVVGYNGFQWIDFDGDGRQDIVAASGNNMEMFDPPLIALHGVYVYLQSGPMQFTKTHFLRMDGVTKALAGDYDDDSDMDIVAISAYPDWRAAEPATFVLFTNQGGGKFSPSTIGSEFCGQAITMDAGDLDGDGDVDVVVGGADWPPLLPNELLGRAMERIRPAPPVTLLRNQTR